MFTPGIVLIARSLTYLSSLKIFIILLEARWSYIVLPIKVLSSGMLTIATEHFGCVMWTQAVWGKRILASFIPRLCKIKVVIMKLYGFLIFGDSESTHGKGYILHHSLVAHQWLENLCLWERNVLLKNFYLWSKYDFSNEHEK